MRDQITIDRIKLLHPDLREKALVAYEEICLALTGRAGCRYAYTLRTDAEQDALYALGRTVRNPVGYHPVKKPFGNIVTWARGGQSYHNPGLALDIVLLIDRDGNGTYEEASWDQNVDIDGDHIADWTEVVHILIRHGFEWGGNWGRPKYDAPHFQMTFGYSIAELKQLSEKEFFINNGVKYPLLKNKR